MPLNEYQSYILSQHGALSDDVQNFNDDNTSMEITYKDGSKKTLCSIFSRCMGYHRPVSDWNIGKKQEFASRKTYIIKEELNKLRNNA